MPSSHRTLLRLFLWNRLEYRYDKATKTWKPVAHRLEAYVFDDQNGGLTNPIFQKPRDCPFRF